MDKKERQRGSVTLETSLVLPIFIILFLFIDGLFGVVSAQNKTTHALIQTSKSLSLDSYLNENVESAAEVETRFWSGFADMAIDFTRLNKDEHFTSQTDWYKFNTANSQIAKKRFIGYLAGGDETVAKELLKGMGIVNDLSGVTFEIKVDTANEICTITMKYQIQYWFDVWNNGRIPMKQTIKTKLWM